MQSSGDRKVQNSVRGPGQVRVQIVFIPPRCSVVAMQNVGRERMHRRRIQQNNPAGCSEKVVLDCLTRPRVCNTNFTNRFLVQLHCFANKACSYSFARTSDIVGLLSNSSQQPCNSSQRRSSSPLETVSLSDGRGGLSPFDTLDTT